MSRGGLLSVIVVFQFLLLPPEDINTILFSLASTNSIKRMQKNNGGGLHQACAACKHQRKKCRENCILAPFFPAEQSQNFQAVHKVFGVSNVQKILRSLQNYDQRIKAVESLIWEATLRQKDPVYGSYGEYMKVVEELRLLKVQQMALQVPDTMMYKPSPGFVGWNNNTNGIGSIDPMSMVMNYNNNYILGSMPYNYVSQVQGEEKISQRREPLGVVCPPQSMNAVNEQYSYLTDPLVNTKSMDDTIWDRRS